jgi:membrane protease subunit HflC
LLGHHHHHGDAGPPASKARLALRFSIAAAILLGGVLAACAVMVEAGSAVVVTRFGDPVAVLTRPGLAWKLPAPIEGVTQVDLRLRTASSGLQDVGTRDGLRVLVQAYVAWQVPDDPAAIRQFLRAVRNDPDEAARQLRSLVGAALQVTASGFDLADLVNTDPAHQRLGDFEGRLQGQIAGQVREVYGLAIRQVGIERIGLPEGTLAATVGRMRAERETVAAQVTTAGIREAAAIRSDAERDSRVALARARTEAAGIEAASQTEAAAIRLHAYQGDPQLYMLLRSLDTLAAIVGPNTRVVLRTDAAPFRSLIEGPPGAAPLPAPIAAAPPPAVPAAAAPGLPPSQGAPPPSAPPPSAPPPSAPPPGETEEPPQ